MGSVVFAGDGSVFWLCSVWSRFPGRSKAHLGLNVNPLPPHFLISHSLSVMNSIVPNGDE